MSSVILDQKKIVDFQKTVMDWYNTHKRVLPWRENPTPYNVFISEMMLQQTQVTRVVPKFLRFIEKVPDFESLAVLGTRDLLELRSGLGFNARALRMQESSRIIIDTYGGVLPNEREKLLGLPGVGQYSSASILAFTYNIDVIVVDINIKRVHIARFDLDEQIKPKDVIDCVGQTLYIGQSRDRYNALMDYGSVILTASKTGIKSPKQSKFVGSPRWVRGQIIKQLLHSPYCTIASLEQSYNRDDLHQILAGLQKEGFILVENNHISLLT